VRSRSPDLAGSESTTEQIAITGGDAVYPRLNLVVVVTAEATSIDLAF
jgi:hypothetical protein